MPTTARSRMAAAGSRPAAAVLAAGALLAVTLVLAAARARPAADPALAARFHADLAVRARAAEAEAATRGSGLPSVAGRDGFRFYAGELRSLAAGRFWGEDAARAHRPAVARPDP